MQKVNKIFDLEEEAEVQQPDETKQSADRVSEIVQSLSKDSEYHKKEQKRLQECQKKVKKYNAKILYLKSANKWPGIQKQVCQAISELKEKRVIGRTWLHFDMDMFFAACEIQQNPSLAEVPIAVGDSQMIQTTNYLARKQGVKSGMPGFIGKKLCPDLQFIRPNYKLYRQQSDKFKQMLETYDADLESIGLDEASLDVTDFLRANNLDTQDGRLFLAQKIRKEIKEVTGGLTASCGIACNRLLAKIACGVNKPDGSTYLGFNADEITEFMAQTPIRKVPGIGQMNEQVLNGLGVFTCKDILNAACEIFVNFTENAFSFLIQAALGISRAIHEQHIQKSIGTSKTFQPFLQTWTDHLARVQQLATEVAQRLEDSKIMAKILTLEVKNAKFDLIQRSTTTASFVHREAEVVQEAVKLLQNLWKELSQSEVKTRLIGIRFNNIRSQGQNRVSSQPQQESLTQLHEFDRSRMNASNRKTCDYYMQRQRQQRKQQQQYERPLLSSVSGRQSSQSQKIE